jgi:sugar phosphate isomerase/epimerase
MGLMGMAALPLAGLASTDRLWAAPSKPDSVFGGVQIGTIAPYSFHNLPDDAPAVLQDLLTDHLSGCELQHYCAEQFAGAPANPGRLTRGMTPEQRAERAHAAAKLQAWRLSVSMDKFKQLRQLYNNAGVTIYALKLASGRFPAPMSQPECEYAFNMAEALGAQCLQIEFPEGKPEITQQLGAEAAKRKMMVGYHAHLDASPDLWAGAMAQSAYNGINLDIGHWVAAGNPDLLGFIRSHHSRITTLHLKDRQNKANGGKNTPWGEGDTPVAEVLQLMQANRYPFPGTIEFEYPVPAGSTSLKEVARCLEFCKKAL